MTAKEIINSALKLLGYTSSAGNEQLTARIMNKAIPIINVVFSDLWPKEHTEDFEPVAKLDDKIKLSNKATSVMVYGVAAFIAQSENDGDQQQIWMTIYNKKISTLTVITTRQDVLPRSWD